jgi:hypothetical protein
MNSQDSQARRLARCIRNDGYPVALELGRMYSMRSDEVGERHGFVRIIDESGESALYPREYFRFD